MMTENIIIGENTKYPLKGRLTLPDDTSKPLPAVVFVHGSGSSNMDEKVGKLTPFRDLAEGLAEMGIVSLRYDKRSFAHGFRMLRDKSRPLTVREETIEDAVLASELLKSDPRIDKNGVFIVGHSMGGMLAPRIDSEGGNFRGLIIMAGTPRKLEEVMREQTEAMLSEMNGFTRRIAEKQIMKLMSSFEGLYDLSDEEAMKKKIGGGTTLYYFKEMGVHDTPSYLAENSKPMLIMQGGRDFQVSRERDFELYKKLLCGRDNVTFKLYEELNHAFVPAISDSISNAKSEYAKERHIGRDVISDIAEWVFGVLN